MALPAPQDQCVLLGFKDAALEGKASSWDVSKIGGLPDPVPRVTLAFPSCPLCSSVLYHVVQVYCPLEGSRYHRTIQVFACSTKSCWGKHQSWVALRSQCQETLKPQDLSKQENKMAAADWCEDADDWGFDEKLDMPAVESHAASCPAVPVPTDWTSQIQNLSLTDPSETIQSCDSVFRSYFIAVAEESDCAWDADLDHARRLLKDYERREEAAMDDLQSDGKGEGEKYEKCDLQNRDLVFHKFLKKISPCRQQILRYSWNGIPLYMSSPDVASQPPSCPRCGARRVFEFQLMPALVAMLQGLKADLLLEFGAVHVFTCERSCWEDSDKIPVQEFCIVQEDPDQRYFH
ncbi:programmed cell death protein 2-like isoform X2 [Rhinoderma darwinii]|uniref:programmed cell death protein 2-like isoform X2 n=1 Tax=Rhinoderma darwinii TaxID=43563 RepID=UPI003F66D28A